MKIKLNRSKLLTALKLVGNNLKGKLEPQVLNNILLKTGEAELAISSFNGSQFAKVKAEAEVIKPGRVSVPGIYLRDLIARFSDAELTLSLRKDRLIVAGDSGVASLDVTDLDKIFYPAQLEDNLISFELERKVVELGIEQTSYCASKELSKRALMGVNIKLVAEHNIQKIAFCATNSHRLATISQQIEANSSKEFECLLDSKTCDLLPQFLSELGEERVKISYDENSIEIIGDYFEITSSLINASYPDYGQLIPTRFSTQVILEREVAISNLHLVSAISGDGVISMQINAKSQEVLFAAESIDAGRGEQKQPGEVISGKNSFSCLFKCNYLLTTLRKLAGKEVKIMTNEANTPILISNLISQQTDYLMMLVQRK